MAPSVATYATPAPATSPITEARYNPTVSEDVPAVAVEHNLEEHVAFGTHQVLCLAALSPITSTH